MVSQQRPKDMKQKTRDTGGFDVKLTDEDK